MNTAVAEVPEASLLKTTSVRAPTLPMAILLSGSLYWLFSHLF